MLSLNAGLGTLLKKSLQAFVPEVFNHKLIVACNATLYNRTMTRPDLIGRLLVAVQFALLAWLIWPLTTQAWSLPALVLVGCAAVLGLWTLFHNRPGNFNIRPEPKASGRLVTGGPYRFVRNPMYSALLLFAAAEVVAYGDPWEIACWLALA